MAAYTDDYTDRRRTRIYQRPTDRTQAGKDDLIGQTQAISVKPRLFDGISIAQVVAGAAAAATSVALSSYIGVAGSIIGAAVSSVVTVISSQLYRRFLDASARKIKDAGEQVVSKASRSEGEAVAEGSPLPEGVRGARIAPSKLRARAAAQRAATQRKVVAFSAVAAVAAVALCAAAIWLGTSGQGIGEQTSVLSVAAPSSNEADVDSTATGATNADAGTDQGAGTAAQGTAGDTASGTDAGNAAQGTGTGAQDQTGTDGGTSSGTGSDAGADAGTGSASDGSGDAGTGGSGTGDAGQSAGGDTSTGNGASSGEDASTSSTGAGTGR